MDAFSEPSAAANAEARRVSGAFTALMIPWALFLVGAGFLGERTGVVPFVVPLWNTLFLVGVIAITVAVFRGRAWGFEWAHSAALLNAINCAWHASDGHILFILGLAMHVAVVIVLRRRRRDYASLATIVDAYRTNRISQRASLVLIVVGVTISIVTSTGTDGSRRRFARMMEKRMAAAEVRVWAEQKTLHVEFPPSAPATNVEKAAEMIRKDGKKSPFWEVGFKSVVIAQGDNLTTVHRP